MKTLALTLLAGGAAALMAIAGPAPRALAQDEAPPGTDAVAVAPAHGSWTLRDREKWIDHALDRAKDSGGIDHAEYDRVKDELHGIRETEDQMRDHQHGELTDNQTAMLEDRLDNVADAIHWLHEHSFEKPW